MVMIPDFNKRMVDAMWSSFDQSYYAFQDRSGMCLAYSRRVIEVATGLPKDTFYNKYDLPWVQPEGYDKSNGHWARDLERYCKLNQLVISEDEVMAGDLAFNWKAAVVDEKTWKLYFPNKPYVKNIYIGHIAPVLSVGEKEIVVMENINPMYRKPYARQGVILQTKLSSWKQVSTFARWRA